MSHTQPTQPYVPHVPPPGSLQEWMVRALAVRAVQQLSDQSDEPATGPIPTPTVSPEPVPAQPAVPTQPAEPEQPAAATHRARLVAVLGRVRRTARAALARVSTTGAHTRWVALVAVITAALAVGVGWQLSQAGGTPTAPQLAIGIAATSDATGDATGDATELTVPPATRPVKPAAFGQVVKLGGWQVKIAGMKNSPQLKAVPGLTTAAYPRALRMSVTLINTTDRALAADAWVLSATVNGKPVQMIIHPPTGYVGVPQQTIQPGGSVVFPIAVALPISWANLTIEAVNAQAALAMSVTGKG